MNGEQRLRSALRFSIAALCGVVIMAAALGLLLTGLLPETPLPPVKVELGAEDAVRAMPGGATTAVAEKAALRELELCPELPELLEAPVEKGQRLGRVTLRCREEILAELPLLAEKEIPRRGRGQIYREMLGQLFGRSEK